MNIAAGTYRVLRAVLVTVLSCAVGIPAILYVALSLPNVQGEVRDIGQRELSKLLETEVNIQDLAFSPFNRITLFDVTIADDNGHNAVTVDRLGMGISLYELIFRGKIVVNYAEIIGFEGNINRMDENAPLNISGIIDRLKGKDKKKKSSNIELSVNTIVMRQCAFSYDVVSAPFLSDNKFDKNHISIKNFNADITIPVISEEEILSEIFRVTFSESAGLTIDNLHGKFSLISDTISITDFGISLPNSSILLDSLSLILDETKDIKKSINNQPIKIKLAKPSYVTPSDFASFSQPLSELNYRLDLGLDVDASFQAINLHKLTIESRIPHFFSFETAGSLYNLSDKDHLQANLSTFSIVTMGSDVDRLIPNHNIPWLKQLGLVAIKGKLAYNDRKYDVNITTTTQCGQIKASATGHSGSPEDSCMPIGIKSQIDWDNIALDKILPGTPLGNASGNILLDGTLSKNQVIQGNAILNIENLQMGSTDLSGLQASLTGSNNAFNVSLKSIDPSAKMSLSGDITLEKSWKSADLRAEIDRLSPSELGIGSKHGPSYSGRLIAGLKGNTLNDVTGVVTLGSIEVKDTSQQVLLGVNSVVLTASGDIGDRSIKLRSDLVDLDFNGAYDTRTLPQTLMSMAKSKLPSLIDQPGEEKNMAANNFSLSARIKETEDYADKLRLPASLMYPMQISATLNGIDQSATLDVDAPYIRQGNKIIEKTSVNFQCDSLGAALFATTKIPSKDGLNTIMFGNNIGNDTILTNLSWKIDRVRDYSGNLGFTTRFGRLEDNRLMTKVNILPGEMEFNDTTWTVSPASVMAYGKDRIVIDHLNASRSGQFVKIDGTVSSSTEDELTIDLSNVNLDYIFESLGIDKARIGGDATGTFTASALLSPEPHLNTPGLNVKGISYNKTVLGDAVVKSQWDGERRAITLYADIDQPNDQRSTIDGAIFPLNDSLDIAFDAHRINVGFLKPFMEAFTSDVEGLASGKARLWGNFKYIDLEGDLHADSIRMKIDFTNTWYTACDSVIIKPGFIDLKDITLSDEMGNTALLNGYVKHTFFKAPEFEFNITDARHLLVYDETEKRNPDWYGRVFANGSAAVKGGPGWVDITADMSTASHSTFTFVLSDMEEAGEYSFITFRNRNEKDATETLVVDPTPDLVKDLRKRLSQKEEEGASRYDMDFKVTITPDAQLVIVMDPIGGDRIRAHGTGTIRMQYGSTDEELRMYGTYTLERGSYNFTLQDIIIKDFTIRDGSSITFTGDPFAAMLNITAVYALNANLSDLDESFLQDRDLNRTNVPVHAILNVAGDLQQPDISFDLEFPTLPSDTYRKVRSIVSTEEMMNRQIIYLLALSRFYTPDYMGGTTRGNELVSVASSTISSQLTNILGQINDKWSIAPNFRSDKGDFSDLEVDLALSSQLLNNRLLFNGNFGYRDNTLNSNQFIGDFDIEYLLNRRGTLRLKAYNRYNDRNYYVKTATTTQGVGIVLRHDFDNVFSIFKKYRKKEEQPDVEPAVPADTILPEPTFPQPQE